MFYTNDPLSKSTISTPSRQIQQLSQYRSPLQLFLDKGLQSPTSSSAPYSHLFAPIHVFTYIRPIHCLLSKPPSKCKASSVAWKVFRLCSRWGKKSLICSVCCSNAMRCICSEAGWGINVLTLYSLIRWGSGGVLQVTGKIVSPEYSWMYLARSF